MAQTTALTIPRLGLGSAEGPPHEAMASAVEAAEVSSSNTNSRGGGGGSRGEGR